MSSCAQTRRSSSDSRPGQLVGRLQRAAADLDAAAVTRRRRRAEADRHVTLRPAPDVMTWLGALLPVKAGVAVNATLHREARSAKAAGDPRSIGQLMADILVQRVIHPALAAPPATSTVSTVPVTVNLIVRDSVLLGDQDGTGWVEGHGPVPGDLIRGWVAENLDTGLQTLGPPALRTARHRQPGRHGLKRRPVHGPARRVPPPPRPRLPHRRVRRAGPSRRPRRAPMLAGDPPRPTTAKDCASSATTPRKQTAGPPAPSPAPDTPSRPPPPPDTPTARPPTPSEPSAAEVGPRSFRPHASRRREPDLRISRETHPDNLNDASLRPRMMRVSNRPKRPDLPESASSRPAADLLLPNC